jgi:GNAT superfamily N-acetyltransferase
MSEWTPEAVRAAADAWVWIPPGAQQIVTSEYQLIAYPAHYAHPTQVAWCKTTRPAADVVSEVIAHVRAWDRDQVYWWVKDEEPAGAGQPSTGQAGTGQAGIEEALQRLGGRLAETVQVLGYDLSDGVPDLGPAGGLQTELVRDERTLRATYLVSAEVWQDDRERTPDAVSAELAGLLESGSDIRVVVFIDGEAAASGGCWVVGHVARLWGAGTRPAFRGRGAYRALLAARIAAARQHGATLALVKGRVETSGPILRRAGFTAYGEERSYSLSLGTPPHSTEGLK